MNQDEFEERCMNLMARIFDRSVTGRSYEDLQDELNDVFYLYSDQMWQNMERAAAEKEKKGNAK